MINKISQHNSDLLIAEQYGLLEDDIGQSIKLSMKFGIAKEIDFELLQERIRKHELEMAKCPFAKPKRLNRGKFLLGSNHDGSEIRCPMKWMGSPSFIGGSTGSGKTNVAKFFMSQLGMHVSGMWAIDCKKSEMKSLVPVFEDAGVDISVVDTQDLKLNPLMVPKFVDPRSFAMNVGDSLIRVLKAPPTARKVLQQVSHQLYSSHGIFDGNTVNYPTMFELRDAITNAKHVHSASREALITALDPILLNLRSIFSYRKGWDISTLAQKKIIFELNSCSDMAQDLIIETLIFSEFQSRVAQGFSNVSPSLGVYVDEGSSLLESSESSIASSIGLLRGLGIILLISNQSAVSISQKVLSNIPNIFVGRCSSYADLNVLCSAVGLDASQKRYLSTHLKPGLLLASLGQGSWRYPFLFKTPLMKNEMGERKLMNINHGLDSLPVVSAPEFLDWEPEWMRLYTSQNPSNTPLKQNDVPRQVEPLKITYKHNLSDGEIKMLKAIAENPPQPVSVFPAMVRFSKSKVIKLRKSLVAKKLIKEQVVQKSEGKGRPSILLAPTKDGLEVLKVIRGQED